MTRGNNFDALRLLGALAVLVAHQSTTMGQPVSTFGGYNYGTLAVFMFFAVSGYLVAGSWESDRNLWRFVARRALRMGPGWAVLMALTGCVLAVVGSDPFSSNPLTVFNGSLWTLPWEIVCYVGLATLGFFMPLRTAALMGALLSLIWWRMHRGWDGPEQLAMMFAAGTMLRAFPIRRLHVALGVAVIAAVILRERPIFVFLLFLPMLCILIGNASWPYVRRAGRFGDFSYGVYIYAFPVQQFGVLWLGKDQPYLLMLSISLVVTGILAFLSWHLVEKPSLRFKPVKGLPQLRSQPSPTVKNTDVIENEFYWYCLADGTWTAMCRVGDRAYWIGDLEGEPMERLTGEWLGPIAPPPDGETTLAGVKAMAH